MLGIIQLVEGIELVRVIAAPTTIGLLSVKHHASSSLVGLHGFHLIR